MNIARSLAIACFALILGIHPLLAAALPGAKLIWITDQFKAYQIDEAGAEGAAIKGHLLVPRGADEPTAAVICRHGLGGSAAEVSGVGMAKNTVHHEFGRLLAEQGYVVFAPSAPGGAAPNAAETRLIIKFLKRLECTDGERIGYYGFDRDGNAAERLAPLLGDLRVAISVTGFSDANPLVLIADGAKGGGKRDVQDMSAADVLQCYLRPAATVWRDYLYTPGAKGRRISGMPFEGGNPFDTHVLDCRAGTHLRGRFWIPQGAGQFHGMAIKVSRDGYPGPLLVRFGSQPGGEDLGVATLEAEDVIPLFDTWHEAIMEPKTVKGGETVFYEISTGAGRSLEDNYVVYGPRHPDGKAIGGERFPLSYRVLTDRPEDRLVQPGKEYAYQFAQEMMGPYYSEDTAKRLCGEPAQENETVLDESWKIHFDANNDKEAVLVTAADDLKRFLASRAGISLGVSGKPNGGNGRAVALVVSDDKRIIGGIDTEEGHRINVAPQRIVIAAPSPRGVMRGVYWLEDMMRFRRGPFIERGVTERNCKFRRRITCAVCPSDIKYTETSYPLPYTDGLLRRISHQGFNAVWLIVSQGEIVVDSKVFPELNDPKAARRLERMRDLVERSKQFGIDVILYFGNEFCSVPESFYKKHPDTKGVGRCYVGGKTMCSSHPDVKRFVAETTRELFRRVPGLGGLCEIYDYEVYRHCAIGNYKACPRCKDFAPEDIAVDALSVIDRAMREVDPHTDHIAWTYLGLRKPWAAKAIAKFPKEMIFQANFARNVPVVRDGVTNHAEDYIICELGPSNDFITMIKKAQEAGLRIAAKTEHATALEFVTVPYYPCMQQWCARAEKLSEFPLDTLWATYCHYGYTPSRTADVLKWYSWTNGPRGKELLNRLARRDFGPGTEDEVIKAWECFTKGFRCFPYSNGVNKYPGPLQTGPSQPLFLDPREKAMGSARAWQNDLEWCRPWGPKITAKYLGRMVNEFDKGLTYLRKARQFATVHGKVELDREIGVAETMKRSAQTMINMIRWEPLRDAYVAATAGAKKEELRRQLLDVGREELANARAALAFAEADSRLGAASSGSGSPGRGGLFTPELIRKKIGLLEDTLGRQLSDGGSPEEKPHTRVYENKLVRIENPQPILADYPRFVQPVRDLVHYQAPPLVLDENADLDVRAWRWSSNARGIIEIPNRLRACDTAIVVVHPWGIEDEQGWKSPQPAGAAFFCTPAKNALFHEHVLKVLNPFLKKMRPHVGLVLYSEPGKEDPIRKKLYRSIHGKPTPQQRAEGQKELEAKLKSFNYNAGSLPKTLTLSKDYPVIDYFRQFPGLDAGAHYNGPGFWNLPIPVLSTLDTSPNDVVIYDGEGYAAMRDFLTKHKIRHILLTGYATEKCFKITTAGYMNLRKDFNVFLVGDASLATFPANSTPKCATNAALSLSALDNLVTQVSWIKLSK